MPVNIVCSLKEYMRKDIYDPDNDGKISLGIINIDQDLNMGPHNILLDNGYKVDGIDISDHTHSLVVHNISDNPTLNSCVGLPQYEGCTVATITHDCVSEHLIINYKFRIKNNDTVDSSHQLNVYIGGKSVKSEMLSVPAGTEKVFEYQEAYDVDVASGVKIEIFVGGGTSNNTDMEGLRLIAQSFTLGNPQ